MLLVPFSLNKLGTLVLFLSVCELAILDQEDDCYNDGDVQYPFMVSCPILTPKVLLYFLGAEHKLPSVLKDNTDLSSWFFHTFLSTTLSKNERQKQRKLYEVFYFLALSPSS